MGLDITAVRQATFLHLDTDCPSEGDHYPEDVWSAYPNSDFPAQADGLPHGCYRYASEFGFRAGSYGGYNVWRDQLSILAIGVPAEQIFRDPTRYTGRPFFHLINFSDCEGLIGPKTSATLVRDFRDLHQNAERFWSTEATSWALAKYRDWAKAFYLAADSGFVKFH